MEVLLSFKLVEQSHHSVSHEDIVLVDQLRSAPHLRGKPMLNVDLVLVKVKLVNVQSRSVKEESAMQRLSVLKLAV